jgi:K+-transporting ATPase c subunit
MIRQVVSKRYGGERYMDEKRKGEIAAALVEYWGSCPDTDIRPGPNHEEELDNIAKSTGIPVAELKEFLRAILEETLEEIFGK